jgi:sigma-B regulation protein RsbU (phosphoserine phosphatase)
MRWWSRPTRPVRAVLALGFAVSLLVYTGLWWFLTRPEPVPSVQLGFNDTYLPSEHAQLINSVFKGSPAEKIGMRAGDRIIAVDGEPVTGEKSTYRIWMRHQPGDEIHLTIHRPGESALVFLTGRFRQNPAASSSGLINQQLSNWFPLPFVLVGLTVLFLRLDDPNAWLLALMFAGIVASRGFPPNRAPPQGWNIAMGYQAVFLGMLGPFFYWFFSVFPARSPIDRRLPWLKWGTLGVGLLLAIGGIHIGALRLPQPLHRWAGEVLSNRISGLIVFAFLTLGLASFALNFFTTRDPDARRKIRVMFWGTVVSIGPNLADLLARSFTGWQDPPWLNTINLALLVVFPLSFAYAVVVHRVLEIPVLLRRSARYLLVQRGFTFLLSLVSIGLTLLFAMSFPRYLQPIVEIAQPSGIALGAVFGTALLWSGTQVHKRVSGRIDRAFFRSAYDARVILEDLAEKARTTTGREELERLLEQHLAKALHPSFLIVHLQPGNPAPDPQPECVVPILGRDGHQLGVLLLGPRLSEEPYSREDQRLLAAVASQAASVLENIRLAEEIAQRIESERRVAREMEIASEVQSRLLPQAPPRLKTLDCAACCVQARAVGGDYYDFLDLGPDRVGLVLGDVSGKGVHAALLVANLEAYLRSQCSIAPLDPVRMLGEVNRLLYRSTAVQHYATLFFGAYDDTTRSLSFVNCGHNPPICLRPDGRVTRLEATATVIGAFPEWQATEGHIQLDPGDLLVIFSDGVTEANRGEEEFGEARLLDEIRSFAGSPVDEIVSGILASVQQFSAGTQYDDLTLVVARARA